MNSKLTPEKLVAFCAALAETGIVSRACKAVGIARVTAYEWRDEHPEFAEAWDKALRIGVTALEDSVHHRAFEGVDKPLVHQGQFTPVYERDERGRVIFDETTEIKDDKPVVVRTPRIKLDEHGNPMIATMKDYSDTLAIFLLKAHNPEKYRERQDINVTGNVDIAARILAGRKRVNGD